MGSKQLLSTKKDDVINIQTLIPEIAMRYLMTFIFMLLSALESHAELNLMPSSLPETTAKPPQEQQEAQNWERLAKDREALEKARKSGDKVAIEAAEKQLKKDRDEIRKAYQKEEEASKPKEIEKPKRSPKRSSGSSSSNISRQQKNMQRQSDPYPTRLNY